MPAGGVKGTRSSVLAGGWVARACRPKRPGSLIGGKEWTTCVKITCVHAVAFELTSHRISGTTEQLRPSSS